MEPHMSWTAWAYNFLPSRGYQGGWSLMRDCDCEASSTCLKQWCLFLIKWLVTNTKEQEWHCDILWSWHLSSQLVRHPELGACQPLLCISFPLLSSLCFIESLCLLQASPKSCLTQALSSQWLFTHIPLWICVNIWFLLFFTVILALVHRRLRWAPSCPAFTRHAKAFPIGLSPSCSLLPSALSLLHWSWQFFPSVSSLNPSLPGWK